MIKTMKNVAREFSTLKSENQKRNDTTVFALRINEHFAVIDADALNEKRLSEAVKARNAERRHQSAIIEVA